MAEKFDTFCGLSCKSCEYKEKTNCGGCMTAEGKPCFSECEVAKCATDKKRRFCGECGEFPCELLKKLSLDAENGDNGARIENCKRIKAELVAEARKGINPLGVCGFNCDHCFMGKDCGGCRSSYNCCSYGTLFEGNVCPNVSCAAEKGLDGCYECAELEGCEKGYYGVKNEYIAKSAALFIRDYGEERSKIALANAIKVAEKTGRTLETAKSVEDALDILKEGLSLASDTAPAL